jgi:hypothetical protein
MGGAMFDQNGVVAPPKGREKKEKWSTCIVQCRSSEVTHESRLLHFVVDKLSTADFLFG